MKTLTMLSLLAALLIAFFIALFTIRASDAAAADIAALVLGSLGIFAVVFHRPVARTLRRRLAHARHPRHPAIHA
ncbi:MAG: hypothetical protein JWN23_2601 [Rhodocyclales bacterium]|nr:hypothetical protein [Rhodocyclales bacterium]